MITQKILLALGCSLLSSAPIWGQLIQNGGFETGDFSDWTDSGTVEIKTGAPGSDFVHAGHYGATLGSGTLSQAFITTPGKTYRVEFAMNAILYQAPGLIEVSWGNFDIPNNLDLGSVMLFDAFSNPSPIPGLGWYKYSYDVLAAGNVGSLKFEFQTQAAFYPNNAALDDVSVKVRPGFTSVPNLAGVPIGDPSPVLTFDRFVLASSVTFSPVPEMSTYGIFAAIGLAIGVMCRRLKLV